MITITPRVTTNRTTLPFWSYRPELRKMMAIRLKMKEPMNVDRAFWAVESCISNVVDLGVTFEVAAAYAETTVVNEKVVTASMLEARIFKIVSTVSAPIYWEISNGTNSPR